MNANNVLFARSFVTKCIQKWRALVYVELNDFPSDLDLANRLGCSASQFSKYSHGSLSMSLPYFVLMIKDMVRLEPDSIYKIITTLI